MKTKRRLFNRRFGKERACRQSSLQRARKGKASKFRKVRKIALRKRRNGVIIEGMNWHSRIATFFLLAAAVFGGGCAPLDNSSVDEEKEAHYLAGKKYLVNRKPEKAIKAFEQSLLAIPDSANAHFQLGSLYLEEEFQNPVLAIYHFEKMLRLREGHHMAKEVREHIYKCKEKIASEVMPLPGAAQTREEMKLLIQKNKSLTDENGKLREKLAQLQGEIGKLKSSLERMASSRSPSPDSGEESLLAKAGRNSAPPAGNRLSPTAGNQENPPPPPENPRFIKHILNQGDSFYALARKYGSSLQAIQNANPSMHPKRLQIGAVVNIPLSSTFTASTR